MKINLRSHGWTLGAAVFSLGFIAWSCFLMIEVDSEQDMLRKNVKIISELNKAENEIEEARGNYGDTTLNSIPADRTDFLQVTAALRKDELVGENVSASIIYFNRADSLREHKKIEKDDFAGQLLKGREISKNTNRALQELKTAQKTIRANQAKISGTLSSKWFQLHFLVIIACLVVVLVYFLLRFAQKNIRQLTKSQEEMKSVNTFLDTVLENIPDMVFVKDAGELRFVRLNKAAEQMLGVSANEMIGKNDFDFFPDGQAEFFTMKDREVLASKQMLDIPEELIETKQGTRWLHSKKLPLTFGEGNPGFLLGISRDITEQKKYVDEIRKFNESLEREVSIRTEELARANERLLEQISDLHKAEKQIKENEQKYEMLINTIDEGVIYTDNNGKILFVNQRFCEMSGYSHGELLETYGEILLGKDENQMKEAIRKRKKGLKESYELNIVTKSGGEITLYVTGVPIKDEQGEIVGTLGSHLDITHIRHTEKKLLGKINDLDMFLYRSSHDLKGPISSMQGLLNLAAKDVNDPVAQNYIRMLKQSTSKLDNVLLGLTEVLTITQGKIKQEIVDPAQLIDEILNTLSYLAGFNDIRIDLQFDRAIKISTDKKILYSVLQNLIHNAIVYRKKAHGHSYIGIRAEKDNDNLSITIEDNGVGIPAELQKKVFDIFFRANENAPGSGLGLYIAKNGVEKIGATISMTSEVGKGTVFIIQIPLTKWNEWPELPAD